MSQENDPADSGLTDDADASHMWLLCGIPGSGKTKFGEILEAEGFFFIELEAPEQPDSEHHHLKQVWDQSLPSGTAFVDELKAMRRSVAVEWGFPVSCTSVVQSLKEAGMRIVWFKCTYEAARSGYIERRGEAALHRFEAQIGDIRRKCEEMAAALNPYELNVLDKDESRRTTADLYEELRRTEPR